MQAFSLLTVLAVAGACASGSQSGAGSALLLDGREFDHFGAGTHQGPAIEVTEVLRDPARFEGQQIRVRGPVESVCQKKGCWVRVGADPNLFVRFKDYAFFLPIDAAGREAVLEGVLTINVISVEDQQHYLEDAGKHDEAKKITAPKREATFMASGASLKKSAGG